MGKDELGENLREFWKIGSVLITFLNPIKCDQCGKEVSPPFLPAAIDYRGYYIRSRKTGNFYYQPDNTDEFAISELAQTEGIKNELGELFIKRPDGKFLHFEVFCYDCYDSLLAEEVSALEEEFISTDEGLLEEKEVEESRLTYCPSCGASISKRAKRCPKCRVDVITCKDCGSMIPADLEECPECGAPLKG